LAYVQHGLAIAGFLLRLKSICIKHSILNTTSPLYLQSFICTTKKRLHYPTK